MENNQKPAAQNTQHRRRRRGPKPGQAPKAAAQGAPRQGQPTGQTPPKKENGGPRTAARPQTDRPANKPAERAVKQPQAERRAAPAAKPRRERQAPAPQQAQPRRAPRNAPRPARRPEEENPGLELISRRPPKQKFANFEEYIAAHGGITAPLPDLPEERDPVEELLAPAQVPEA